MILNHAPFWSNSLAQTSGNIYLLALLTWSLIYYRCITVRAVPVSKSNFVSFIIEANSLQRFCDDQQSQLYETLRIINCSDRIFSQTSHFCFEEDFNPIFLYFTDMTRNKTAKNCTNVNKNFHGKKYKTSWNYFAVNFIFQKNASLK